MHPRIAEIDTLKAAMDRIPMPRIRPAQGWLDPDAGKDEECWKTVLLLKKTAELLAGCARDAGDCRSILKTLRPGLEKAGQTLGEDHEAVRTIRQMVSACSGARNKPWWKFW